MRWLSDVIITIIELHMVICVLFQPFIRLQNEWMLGVSRYSTKLQTGQDRLSMSRASFTLPEHPLIQYEAPLNGWSWEVGGQLLADNPDTLNEKGEMDLVTLFFLQ